MYELNENDCFCVVDGHHGIYVPQVLVQHYEVQGISKACEIILRYGPEHRLYSDACDELYDNGFLVDQNGDKFYLLTGESGDLFAIRKGLELPDDF